MQISATDADDGDNGLVTYRLVTSTSYFSLGETSGVITVSRALAGAGATVHTLQVTASDRGNPRRSTNGSAFVLVLRPR